MKRIVPLMLLLVTSLSAHAYDFVRTLNKTASTSFDTRCFIPFAKLTFPTIVLDEGNNLAAEHWRFYIAGGDNTVTSPVCGAIALVWSTSGAKPTTNSLVQTNANDPTFTVTNAVAGTNTFHAIATNVMGSVDVTRAAWTVNAGVPSVIYEEIPQNGRSFFVANGGLDTANGVSITTPLQHLSAIAGKATLAGDDVYLLAGSTFDEQVTWNAPGGVDATVNRQIVGSYYCAVTPGTPVACSTAGARPYVNSPTNYTVSRRPSTYARAATLPKIRGTYLQTCRTATQDRSAQTQANGLPVSGKCGWHIAAFVSGVTGNYSPGGSAFPVRPTSHTAALFTILLAPNKKYVTVQDIEFEGSAGYSFSIGTNPAGQCFNNSACAIESIIQRLKTHQSANASLSTGGINKLVIRQNDVYDTNLYEVDKQIGGMPVIRVGGSFVLGGCSDCQVLVEGNDIHDQHSECIGMYFGSRILIRGNVCSNQSISGGADADIIVEQNVLFGTLPPYTPPGIDTRFPFWSLAHENKGGGPFGPPAYIGGRTIGAHRVRRDNFIASGATLLLSSSADTVPGPAGPFAYTFVSEWDVGNTFIGGSQKTGVYYGYRDLYADSSKPPTDIANCGEWREDTVGCRARPASFLNVKKTYNNIFAIQSGYTAPASNWCLSSKGTLGTITWGYNQWASVNPGSACTGTGDITSTNTGLPAYDFVGAEWRDGHIPIYSDFTPSAGAGANAGIVLDTNDGAIDTGTQWDWVLAQRVWLSPGNTTGVQVPKAEWIKVNTFDYNGNPRSATTPDLGAIEYP